MSDDDDLRNHLHREAVDRRSTDASSVLAGLRPSMHRARRARVASAVGVALFAVGGVAAGAMLITRDEDAALRIAAEPTLRPTVPSVLAPTAGAVTTVPDEDAPAPSADDATADGLTVDTATIDTATIDAATIDTVTIDDHLTGTSIAPPVPADGAAPVNPAPEVPDADDAPGAGADDPGDGSSRGGVPTTVAAPTTVATPPAPPATTTVAAPSPTTTTPAGQRFESACGYAIAIVGDGASETVEIVEIVDEPGYAHRVEDAEGGHVTIQFTGAGEDCELTIPGDDADDE